MPAVGERQAEETEVRRIAGDEPIKMPSNVPRMFGVEWEDVRWRICGGRLTAFIQQRYRGFPGLLASPALMLGHGEAL